MPPQGATVAFSAPEVVSAVTRLLQQTDLQLQSHNQRHPHSSSQANDMRIRTLTHCLATPTPGVRAAAAGALACLSAELPHLSVKLPHVVFSALSRGLGDGDAHVRRETCRALCRLLVNELGCADGYS